MGGVGEQRGFAAEDRGLSVGEVWNSPAMQPIGPSETNMQYRPSPRSSPRGLRLFVNARSAPRSWCGYLCQEVRPCPDRKSTRLNSSHQIISYAVFCLKKKKKRKPNALVKHKV